MTPTRGPLHRRTLLRGAGGIAVALPFLEAMRARRVRAADRAPLRFLAVFESNGYVRDTWRPTGTEKVFQLSRVLKPLEPFKDALVIVDGLPMKTRGPGSSHMKGIGAVFTGCELRSGSFSGGGTTAGFAAGPSIDQYIASKLGGSTRLRSLELGVKCDAKATPETRCFVDLNRQPVPPLGSPAAAFDRLFGGGAPAPPRPGGAPAGDPRPQQRKMILDFVLDDYRRLRSTLGGGDRARLEAHLDAIQEIDRRLRRDLDPGAAPAAPAASCAKPTGSFGATAGACQGQDDCSDAELLTVGRLHMDLVALAFACDLVRVAGLQWSNAGNRIVYRSLGHTQTHHDLAHAAAKEPLTQISVWYAQQAAYLLGKLRNTKDVDGASLLDNALVLFGNELANGATHSHGPVPFVLAGKAGGRLTTGRYVTSDRPHNALLVSCLQMMGLPDTSFGTLVPNTGPLPGLA